MNGPMELEERVTELELRSMAQQDLLQQLNDALVAQQRELDTLRLAVLKLSKKVDVIPGQVENDPNEKPPHY